METMVYVLSDCAWRDGATVLCVADKLEEAFAAGVRHAEADPQPGVRWMSGWKAHDPSDTDQFTRWTRDALSPDGGVHPSIYQEIVRVPLVVG